VFRSIYDQNNPDLLARTRILFFGLPHFVILPSSVETKIRIVFIKRI
jgi:hypothetical protein